MRLTLVTPSTSEPLTTDEVIAHLRLDGTNTEPLPVAPTVANANVGAGNVDVGSHRYRLTFVTAAGETTGGDSTSPVVVTNGAVDGQLALSNIALGGDAVIARNVYRTVAGGDTFYLVGTINDNVTTTFTDNVADAALGASCPTVNTTDDPYLTLLIRTVREHTEKYLRRTLMRATWLGYVDEFPCLGNELRLPNAPLLAVNSVEYIDDTGTWQLVDPTVYDVDPADTPGIITLGYGQMWPVPRCQRNAVRVNFDAGYGTVRTAIPAPIRTAMLMAVADVYENREPQIIGTIINESPTMRRLLAPYRLPEFF